MKKKIKDLTVPDVKKYCYAKKDNIEHGFCAGCPFRVGKLLCLTTLFLEDGSIRTDVTTRLEMKTLREFKETYKYPNEEIEVLE